VSEAGGVEDGPVSPGPGLSSTEWMTGWRVLIASLAAVALDIGDDERDEVWDDQNLLRALLFPGRES
jgi:hypothetical protein